MKHRRHNSALHTSIAYENKSSIKIPSLSAKQSRKGNQMMGIWVIKELSTMQCKAVKTSEITWKHNAKHKQTSKMKGWFDGNRITTAQMIHAESEQEINTADIVKYPSLESWVTSVKRGNRGQSPPPVPMMSGLAREDWLLKFLLNLRQAQVEGKKTL